MTTIRSLVTENNATVLDVRGPWEFEEGHVDGAINIPLDEIPMRIEEIKSMNLPLVVYCRSGNRSGMAEMILNKLGSKKCTTAGDWPICALR